MRKIKTCRRAAAGLRGQIDPRQCKKMEHKIDLSTVCFKRQHLKSSCCLHSPIWLAVEGKAGHGGELAEELWLYPRLTSAAEAGWLNKLLERERFLILLSTGGHSDKELADKAAARIGIQV